MTSVVSGSRMARPVEEKRRSSDELHQDRFPDTSGTRTVTPPGSACRAGYAWQIPELAKAIRQAIDWNSLPRVSSTELFLAMKLFLLNAKKTGRLLATADDLLLDLRWCRRRSTGHR